MDEHGFQKLQRDLELYQHKRGAIIDWLIGIEMQVKPLVKNYQQKARWSRFHPYSHTSSLTSIPSSTNSYNPRSRIKIPQIDEVASRSSSLSSYQTVIDEVKGSKWNPIYVLGDDECEGFHEEEPSVTVKGSKWNPIYILGDDECEGCHEEGPSVIVKGSKWDPIYVLGDDECEGCHGEGHSLSGCSQQRAWI
jgi:hypothetical protein